jgi:hypothetical protein
MLIKLSPVRCDNVLSVTKAGDVLTINGEAFDFSLMSNGDTLPREAIASEWFAGDVSKVEGELALTLMLPLPAHYSPEQAYPVDLVDVPNGLVQFPQPLPEVSVEPNSEEQE